MSRSILSVNYNLNKSGRPFVLILSENMKTRNQRAGLKNVTNIKGNNKINKNAKTAKKSGASKSTTPLATGRKELDIVCDKSPSPVKTCQSHVTPRKAGRNSQSNADIPSINTRTPSSVFQAAKSAFRRCSTPAKLIGRDDERKAIQAFIEHHVLDGNPGALYISGCPGTGKTALLNEVCSNLNSIFQKVRICIHHHKVET